MMNRIVKNTGGHLARVVALMICTIFVMIGYPGTFAVSLFQDDAASTLNKDYIVGSVYASAAAAGNTNQEADDYDLYKVASDATASFQNALGGVLAEDTTTTGGGSDEEASEEESEAARTLLFGSGDTTSDNVPKTGNVCTYLGYVDSKKSDWVIKVKNVFSTENTAASSKFSYAQFNNMSDILGVQDSVTGNGKGMGFQSYANYGRMLADLGFDTVGHNNGILRVATGWVLIFAYLLASSVPLLFAYVVKFLNMINPFVLLGEGAYDLADSPSSLNVLGKWVANLWDALQSLSLVAIIPLFFAFAFGSALLMYQPGGSSKIGDSILKFAIRIFFIILAVPITGAIYTSFLGQVSSMSGYGSDAADTIIYSEVIDFQGWASKTRLAPPSGKTLSWDIDNACAKLPDGSIRSMVISINNLAGHGSGSGGRRATYDIGEDRLRTVVKGPFSVIDLSQTKYVEGSDKWKTAKSTSKGLELLKRYSLGNVYSSSAYASEVNGARLAAMKANEDDKETISKMFLEGDVGGEVPYTMAKTDLGAKNIFGNGVLNASGDHICTYNVSTAVSGDSNPLGYGGLSTVGMYNYLNSTFSDSEITVFSSKYSTSEYVKDAHFSVSILGSGVWKGLWYTQSLVTLLCMGIIGLIYALAMAMTGIRQGGRMLAALPGAALGSMQFIGRFIAAFIVMIADVLISVVLYSFFCEFLNVAVQATSNIIPSSTSIVGVSTTGGSNMPLMVGNVRIPLMVEFGLINFIGVVFSILLIIYITWMAIRNRTILIHSVDEVVSGSLGRMLGAKNGIGRGHKSHSLLGAAAGTALGVAGGQMIAKKFENMGDGDNGDKAGEGGAKGGLKAAVAGMAGGGSSGAGDGNAVYDGVSGIVDKDGSFYQESADGQYSRKAFGDGTVVESNDGGKTQTQYNPDGSTSTRTQNAAGEWVETSSTPSMAIDNLDNVDAETGAMTVDGANVTGKSVQASGNADVTADGGSVTAGEVTAANVRQVNAPSVSGTVAQGGEGGGSAQSIGSMPERNAKTAKFYAGADKQAAQVMDNSPEAQAKPGYVKSMSSGAFNNGEFTGNAHLLTRAASQGTAAANFVQQYNNATDEKWKAANAQKYQKARSQVIRSQHIMKQAGVSSANSSQIMSQSQWNALNRTLSNDYAQHVKGGGQQRRGTQTRPSTGRTQATRARRAQAGGSSGGASSRGGQGRSTI